MTLPGFSAEAGLHTASGDRGRAAQDGMAESADRRSLVEPQGPVISLACWIICRAAGGSRSQCLEFCTEIGTIFDPLRSRAA